MHVEFEKLGLSVSLTIARYGQEPFKWSHKRQRKFAFEIQRRALEIDGSATKIPLIKACKFFGQQRGYIGKYGINQEEFTWGLRDAKEFVELVFANNGNSGNVIA